MLKYMLKTQKQAKATKVKKLKNQKVEIPTKKTTKKTTKTKNKEVLESCHFSSNRLQLGFPSNRAQILNMRLQELLLLRVASN